MQSLPNSEQDELFMSQALAFAELAEEGGEVPVGAVLVEDGQIIATGCNRSISGSDPTAHAEIVALREAANAKGNYRLPGTTLYVTLEPCAMCAGAIVQARIARVVFGAHDPRAGAGGSVLNVLQNEALNHRAEVTDGVLASECADLLRKFFRGRRNRA